MRKPNSKYLGGDYVISDLENENNATATTSKAQKSPKPKWRQQWRRVPPPAIPQNQGKAVVSPVLPTMAPMQSDVTNSAAKPQTASKGTSKTTSKGQLISE